MIQFLKFYLLRFAINLNFKLNQGNTGTYRWKILCEFCWEFLIKNFENRLTFKQVIGWIKLRFLFMEHGVCCPTAGNSFT